MKEPMATPSCKGGWESGISTVGGNKRGELEMAVSYITSVCCSSVLLLLPTLEMKKITDQRDEELTCQDLIGFAAEQKYEPPSFLLRSL